MVIKAILLVTKVLLELLSSANLLHFAVMGDQNYHLYYFKSNLLEWS